MTPVLAFDVNETLLDLAALDPLFARLFGSAVTRREWFDLVLQQAFAHAATGTYVDFGAIARGALEIVAERHGTALDDDDRAAVAAGMRALPAHPEVPDALGRLQSAGFTLAALSNSPAATLAAQLDHADLTSRFADRISVEAAGALKPAPAVYHHAAECLGVAPGALLLVAAHSWDCTGALRAGCRAAFVARPGQPLDPLGEAPEVVGADLAAVADQLLARPSA